MVFSRGVWEEESNSYHGMVERTERDRDRRIGHDCVCFRSGRPECNTYNCRADRSCWDVGANQGHGSYRREGVVLRVLLRSEFVLRDGMLPTSAKSTGDHQNEAHGFGGRD